VGKSALSYPLARRYDVNLTEIDDFQVVIEKLTTPEQQPALHWWRTDWDSFSAMTDEESLAHSIEVSRDVFRPALESVIANHLDGGSPVLLEGSFLLPELAAFDSYDDEPADGRIRALFVYEKDEAQIAANFLAREGTEQQHRPHSSWLHSDWLRAECDRLGVPAIPARPWPTVIDRAVAALADAAAG